MHTCKPASEGRLIIKQLQLDLSDENFLHVWQSGTINDSWIRSTVWFCAKLNIILTVIIVALFPHLLSLKKEIALSLDKDGMQSGCPVSTLKLFISQWSGSLRLYSLLWFQCVVGLLPLQEQRLIAVSRKSKHTTQGVTTVYARLQASQRYHFPRPGDTYQAHTRSHAYSHTPASPAGLGACPACTSML